MALFAEVVMQIQQWLQAQEGTAEKVSLEGFVEEVGDFMRNLIHGKKPKPESFQVYNFKKIKDTYGNPHWLAKRRFVTGQVKVKEGSLVAGDYASDIKRLLAAISALDAKNVKKLEPYWKTAADLVAFLDSEKSTDPDACSAYNDKRETLPEGLNFIDLDWRREDPQDAELPALTKDQVIVVVNQIDEMVKAYYSRYKNLRLPESTEWNSTFYAGDARRFTDEDPASKKFEGIKSVDLDEMCEELATWCYGVEYDWGQTAIGWSEVDEYLRMLVRWIDASVK